MNIYIYIQVYEKIAGNIRQDIIKKIGGWLIRKLGPGPSCATFPLILHQTVIYKRGA